MKVFLQSHWKLVLGINLLLGITLWFGFFTDVSLRGTIPDILFPPLVAIIAMKTLEIIPLERKSISKLGLSPSFIGGCLFLLMGCFMLIPPFTLGFLFGVSEITSEVRIQRIASPDNIHLAVVYFRPVGAYSGGSGRISVRVTNRFLPFVERDIYYMRVSHANENTQDYLTWKDNNTLYISENNQEVSIGTIQPSLPTLAVVPLMAVGFVQNQIEESQLTVPLHDIPIYPANREHESMGYWDIKKTSRRIYFLPQAQVEEVYDWHIASFSESPWEIVDIRTVSNSDPAYQGYETKIYCITAQKNNDDQTMIYYFEITKLHGLLEPDYEFIDPNVWDVRVIAATPNPDSIYCWLK